MTTKERKTIQNFVNRMTELRETADSAFKELQTLNKSVSGTAWCSAESNYKDIVECLSKPGCSPHIADRAQRLYEQYVGAEAQQILLQDLMTDLANIGFWK